MAQAVPEKLALEFHPEVEVSDIVNVEVNFDTFEAGKILWFMDKTGIATYAEAVLALCMCGLGFTILSNPASDANRAVLRGIILALAVLTGGLIDHDTGW